MAQHPALPLTGIRALDCTQWNSGPYAMRLLADLGAEVIKIESVQHPDPLRMALGRRSEDVPEGYYERSSEWNYVNRNKLGLTLDLSRPEGTAILLKLVAHSQILAENLRPGVWEKFGLGFENLTEVNPGLVFLKMPGYGTTGPWSDRSCWAMAIDQMAGYASYTGYEDGPPLSHALWSDYANGIHVGFALLAALWQARRDKSPQLIDLSQLEVAAAMNAEMLIDYQLNGRVWQRNGAAGRHGMSPHGCFPCAGDDQWIAITVSNDDEWRGLCSVAGNPAWGEDPRFATAAGRLSAQSDIHEKLATWTFDKDKWDLTHRLQGAGVPAFAVAAGNEVAQDQHHWQRGAMERVTRAVVGERAYVGAAFAFSRTPLTTRLPAPTLGQHNRQVLRDWAALSDDEIDDLERRDIIGTRPLGS